MSRQNDAADVFQYYEMKGPDECWRYTGNAWGGQAREQRPYFQVSRRRMIAYRWIYELVHGVTLTSDQLVLHSCDNGGHPIGCGNPAHMRVGTTQENSDDMTRRGRHGLPATAVRAIRKLISEGVTQEVIASRFGVSRETISAIATMRAYGHLKARTDEEQPTNE